MDAIVVRSSRVSKDWYAVKSDSISRAIANTYTNVQAQAANGGIKTDEDDIYVAMAKMFTEAWVANLNDMDIGFALSPEQQAEILASQQNLADQQSLFSVVGS